MYICVADIESNTLLVIFKLISTCKCKIKKNVRVVDS